MKASITALPVLLASLAIACDAPSDPTAPANPPIADLVPGDRHSKIVWSSLRKASSGYDILIMNGDGSGFGYLTFDSNTDRAPALSPDRKWVAFSRNQGGYEAIYVTASDGSGGLQQITPGLSERNPTWSPDGKWIAYNAAVSAGNSQIFKVRSDGSGSPIQVTSLAQDATRPDWSPDGAYLAVVSRDAAAGNPNIYKVKVATGTAVRLTSTTYGDWDPAWSPDGSLIAYASNKFWSSDIFTVDPQGTTTTRITSHPEGERLPAWSPDGTRIAFEAERGSWFYLHRVWSNGTGEVRLPNMTGLVDTQPHWR